jgi:hypothetical protein
MNYNNWLHEKSWTDLHFQFSKFQLFEKKINYPKCIVEHAETTHNCLPLLFISYCFCKFRQLNKKIVLQFYHPNLIIENAEIVSMLIQNLTNFSL